jgi:hypothetical protein
MTSPGHSRLAWASGEDPGAEQPGDRQQQRVRMGAGRWMMHDARCPHLAGGPARRFDVCGRAMAIHASSPLLGRLSFAVKAWESWEPAPLPP